MYNTHLVQLVKSLTPEELKELALFVDSSFFNRSKFRGNMSRLLSLMVEIASGEWEFDKKAVFGRLFPGEKETGGRLEKNMSELSKLIRAFMLTNHYWRPENEFYQNLDWAGLLRGRSLNTRYQHTIGQLRESLGSGAFETTGYCLKQVLFEKEVLLWESYYNQAKGGLNLPALFHRLEVFYHLNRLEWINKLLLQQKVAQVTISNAADFLFLEISIPVSLLQESASLQINFQIYQLLKQDVPDVQGFNALADLIKQHEERIESDELQEFYAFLRNLCTLLFNYGHFELLPLLFQLQKDNLEKGYFYHDGKIPHAAFGSIVSVAIKIEAYAWALQFMEMHKDRIIGGEENNDLYRLSMANYFFAQKEFEKTLDWIPAAPQNTMFLYRARRLKLKAYYETHSDLLFYELDAFKMLISRASQKLISPQFRELHANFVNYLYQIAKSIPGDKARLRTLAQRISAKTAIAEKDWLLEKLEGMG
ncbi:MAG: hypothetical protein H7246_12295 [Phycisphaerae bacterium]|nr:hypothetical protein [Saprospiraceae bacterium]